MGKWRSGAGKEGGKKGDVPPYDEKDDEHCGSYDERALDSILVYEDIHPQGGRQGMNEHAYSDLHQG